MNFQIVSSTCTCTILNNNSFNQKHHLIYTSICQEKYFYTISKKLYFNLSLIFQFELIRYITKYKPMSQQNINQKFASFKQVQEYAQKTDKTLLILNDYILDVTTFASHHPGGAKIVKECNLKNVEEQMKFHHPLTLDMANTMAIGSFKKDIERIIHPDQALLTQIWNLNHQQYMHVITSPYWLFVQSPKMFESDFLDQFSHCQWYNALLMPIFVVSYLFLRVSDWSGFNMKQSIFAFAIGLLFFTLVEYCMHRFIFHSDRYIPNSRVARYVHFFAHGIHHMLPNDPDRLVLPPPLYCIIFTLGYFTLGKIVVFDDLIFQTFFWFAFQIGYVSYDVSHYALHHIDTSKTKGGYFHSLQRYHNQHHFGGEQAGFGVSSKLWDVVFGTGYSNTKKE